MRPLTRTLAWAAALGVASLIGLVAVALTIDPDTYRPALERSMSSALGRRVSIERLSFALALSPTFSVRDLRIANPPWASRPDLISAVRGEVQVDLVPLLHGQVSVRRIALEGVDLLYERSADGALNWVFGPERPGADRNEPRPLPDIDTVALQDARVGWRGADGRVQEARITTASATLRADRPFRLTIEGILRDTPVRIDAAAKSSLQDAVHGKPWEVAVAFSGPKMQASLDAIMPRPFSLDDLDLRLKLEGARLDALSGLAGKALPAWGPYRMAARARLTGSAVQLSDLALILEGLPWRPARIEVSGGAATFGESVTSRVTLRGKLDEADFELDATSAPFPLLLKPDAALPVTAHAVLSGLALDATGTIAPDPSELRFDLAVKAQGDALAPARLVSGQEVAGALPLKLAARISGAGARYRASAIGGSVAGCTVAGDLAVDTAGRTRVSGTLALGELDLAAFGLPRSATRPARAGATPPPAWLQAFDADLALRIAGIAGLGLPVQRVAGRASLENGRIRIDGFSAAIARTEVTGQAALRWSGQRPWLDARLRVPVLDVAAFDGEGSASHSGSEWIDAPLPLAPLEDLDGVAQLEVGRVAGTRVPIKNLQTTARLQDGRLSLSALSAVVAGVPVRGRASLDAGGEPRLTTVIATDAAELAPLVRSLGQDTSVSGQVGPARFSIDTRGRTPRALAGNARAVVRVDHSKLALDGEQPVMLERVTLRAEPAAAVRLDAAGTQGTTAFDLAVTGGPLAELFDLQRAWPTIAAELDAMRGNQRLQVSAGSGPLHKVLSGRDVPVRIAVRMEGMQGQLTGTIADLKRPASSPLRADVTIDSLARLAHWLPAMRLPEVPLRGSAVVTLEPGAAALRDVKLESGRTDVAGALKVKWKDRTEIALDVESQLIDLGPWMPRSPQSETALPADADWPVPLETLRALDASVRVRARRLIGPRADLNDVTVDASLQQGLLELSGGFAEGDTRAELRFDARGSVAQAAARIQTRDLDQEALKLEGFAPLSEGPRISLQAALAGTGATPAALLRSARGEVLATAGAGKVRQVVAPYQVQDVLRTLLTVLVPGRELQEYADLDCAAMRFAIADGVASSPDGIALRFKRIDILGSGAVNLGSREVLFGFRAVRRKWLDFSLLEVAGDLAQIKGTLDRPTVGLDTQGLLVKGAAAWATSGISLLAVDTVRQLGRAENPCAAIAAKGKTSSDPLDALMRALPKTPGGPATSP